LFSHDVGFSRRPPGGNLTRPVHELTCSYLAELRLADAQILLAGRRYAAAYYLAGYAVECGLKACIARQFKLYEFPPRNADILYRHGLDALAKNDRLAGALEAKKNSAPRFASNWSIVIGWSEQSRYKYDWSRQEAEALLNAITEVPDGVMEWIRQFW
jgi:HEPN domain